MAFLCTLWVDDMGKDDARLRSCRSGGAMSLLQAASLNTVAIYFLNGFFLIFLWVFLCVRVCVFAGDRDCRSRDRFQRVCVRRVRASRAHRISQSANRDSLCFAGRRLLHPHLSGMEFFFCTIDESTGETSSSFWRGMGIFFFLFNNRWGDWRCPASSFADGDFLLLHNRWGEILERLVACWTPRNAFCSRGQTTTTDVSNVSADQGRRFNPFAMQWVSFKWLYKRLN